MTSRILDTACIAEQYSIDSNENVLVPLQHLTCYDISGADAQSFLQGQFSNDVAAIGAGTAQLSSYCTPKGRMLSTFYLCQWQDKYRMILSADNAEQVITRLKMFVLRAKVAITPSENNLLLGISAARAGALLNQLGLSAPAENYQCASSQSGLCINIPGLSRRYLILADERLNEKIDRLDINHLRVYSHEYWQWLDIMAGMPTITQATQEAFVPQMANLELIDGVSFTKGCYPGQEVVARLHYLGQASRRLFRLEADSRQTIKAGDNIYQQDGQQAVGKLVAAVALGDHQYAGLGVLRIEAARRNRLVIGAPDGAHAHIMPLPYAVPTSANRTDI